MKRRNIDTTRPVAYKTVAETAKEWAAQQGETSRRTKFFGNGDRNVTMPLPCIKD